MSKEEFHHQNSRQVELRRTSQKKDFADLLASGISFVAALWTSITSAIAVGILGGGSLGYVFGPIIGFLLLGGVLFIHHFALKRLPQMQGEKFSRTFKSLLSAACALTIISVSSSYLGVAHKPASDLYISEMAQFAEANFEDANLMTTNVLEAIPAVKSATYLADQEAQAELEFGKYSGKAGRGSIYSELVNIRNVGISSTSTLQSFETEAEDIAQEIQNHIFFLTQILRDEQKSFQLKSAEARDEIDEINAQLANLKQLIPLRGLEAFQKTLSRDLRAVGVDEKIAAEIAYQFDDTADALRTLHVELKAAVNRGEKSFPELSPIQLVTRYFAQLWPLGLICLVADLLALLPLGLSIIGSRPDDDDDFSGAASA